MVKPALYQIDAGIETARAQLTAISTWIMDYNSKINDAQMLMFMTEVASAILNAQPPKGKTP